MYGLSQPCKAIEHTIMTNILKRIRNKVRRVRTVLSRIISDRYESVANPSSIVKKIETKSGWSVVIVTSGKANDFLKKVMESALSELKGTPFEIIVVGPASVQGLNPDSHVRYIPYHELNISLGWITKKKNLGIASAIYDKVVITHDYLAFEPGWKKGFDSFGSDFDVCMNQIVNTDGTRYVDWITADFPEVGHGSLPYEVELSKYQYIGGSYFVVKRNFFAKYPLDEKYRWGQAEDVYWSRVVRKVTTFKMNVGSKIRLLKYKPLPTLPVGTWQGNTEKIKEKIRTGAQFL